MTPSLWIARFPWLTLAAAAGLVILGWVGISRSEELAGGTPRYAGLQMGWLFLAVCALLAATWPSYRTVGRYSHLIFAAVLALLVVVYFLPAVHGTHRWIRVAGVSLQPSEFAKPAYILALARWLMHRESHRQFRGLMVPLGMTLLPVLLVLREPDLGTALVFVPVLFVMLFAAGARGSDLAKLGLCGLICLPLLWSQMSREQRSRVTALFQQNAPHESPSDDGYHLHQAKQLLALGGAWGSLLAGQPTDDQAAYRLPEDHTDFVFIVICERLGWFGAGAALSAVVVLSWRGLVLAERTREPFARLLIVGVVSLFAVQSLINTAMTVGLLPITGLSFPLVSYGGSGLIAHALALGLVCNVALRPGYELAPEPFRARQWA